jgi:uncharacterized membrane protein YeaQ/YmgE (transglycosylase-associated protein family)
MRFWTKYCDGFTPLSEGGKEVMILGAVGAVVGGFLGSFIGLGKVESFDLGASLLPPLARLWC